MRLIVARCEVVYSGRLNAFLPDSMRLIMLKADGSVLVHADAGGYKPLNWMTPPTTIEQDGTTLVVWSPDYDGKGKAWVRFDDGRDAIVGGSRVERL